ncbi:hypothetical protein LSTR_LSTR000128 [Laodelphax striatellus]|uniref:Uncharacterized protein n=1 Tax=Laodelphax striatellus TaxID=195883 RepID=A0A482X6L2_LAOST|nr:hypothetical protein LSTR_LSTR000128 [Laodelphax striatellus]
METHQTIALPHVDDSNVMSDTENSKTRVLQLLDQVESVVEKLRRDALKMEEDRDSVFTTLDTIRNSDMLTELSDSKYHIYQLSSSDSLPYLFHYSFVKTIQEISKLGTYLIRWMRLLVRL